MEALLVEREGSTPTSANAVRDGYLALHIALSDAPKGSASQNALIRGEVPAEVIRKEEFRRRGAFSASIPKAYLNAIGTCRVGAYALAVTVAYCLMAGTDWSLAWWIESIVAGEAPELEGGARPCTEGGRFEAGGRGDFGYPIGGSTSE